MRVGGEKRTNVVELAIAASLLSGKLDTKNVAEFAKEMGVALKVDDAIVRDAAAKWGTAQQTVAWRNQAAELIGANRELLTRLAGAIEAVAKIAGAPKSSTNPALIDDYLIQHGTAGGARAEKLSSVIGSETFLKAGRFAGLPDGTELPVAIGVGKKRAAALPVKVDRSKLDDPTTRRLSDAMNAQWGFLHERAVEGFVNVNTLGRSAYNAFGVRQILQNFEDRGIKNGRVLLVTGYETPLHELLESDRVKEVRVVDLSSAAAELVAKKYANHPNAAKLKVEVADCSGVSPRLQAEAMNALGVSADRGEKPPLAVVNDYFQRAARPENQAKLPFDSGAFDAVHLPFVLGAFDLGPITEAMVRHRAATKGGQSGYEDYLGADALASELAARSTEANTQHVMEEAARITKSGGLVVANLWARPQADAPGKIRFSDTPLTHAAFDRILAGYEHLFSGNPQPTLPHTVGHVIAREV